MEDFLPGLLMVRRGTAYELHVQIRDNYKNICSHSLGNIQRALKKLHEKGFVTMEEVKEGKVLKKIFSITLEGRQHFMTWLRKPIAMNEVKNPEMGRLLLLGFLSVDEQLKSIEASIESLKEDLNYLMAIMQGIQTQLASVDPTDFYQAHSKKESEYMKDLEAVVNDCPVNIFHRVNTTAVLVLRYAMDETKFNIEWFEKLKQELLIEKKDKNI